MSGWQQHCINTDNIKRIESRSIQSSFIEVVLFSGIDGKIQHHQLIPTINEHQPPPNSTDKRISRHHLLLKIVALDSLKKENY